MLMTVLTFPDHWPTSHYAWCLEAYVGPLSAFLLSGHIRVASQQHEEIPYRGQTLCQPAPEKGGQPKGMAKCSTFAQSQLAIKTWSQERETNKQTNLQEK